MSNTTKAEALDIQSVQLKKAALFFRAINHKLRQDILKLVHKNERMDVTNIYVKLKIEQSVASQHLAILRRANLVLTERAGKQIFYAVNYQQIKQLHSIAQQLNGE
ncbi:MAG TPA: metalloregulator ArsR/SmtB family transcription factor [Flavipsychrobacter sp.]|nr:metalloregulator ArsR/SmtB family transcription factor [Flavipsychrobacter sp.]